jgi:inosine/xanthosine triphosphate pyrophosphatase family protein
MRKIIFASNNKHKAEEIRAILGAQFDIITLKEAGISIDIPEPHETLTENAGRNQWSFIGLQAWIVFPRTLDWKWMH